MSKEEIYDSLISPLMSQVIAICHEHKIPMVADFTLDFEDGLHCTTALVPDEYEPSEELKQAAAVCLGKSSSPPPFYITTRDGNGNITRMDAIL